MEFRWGPDSPNGTSSDKVTTCRNSVQGKVLLADDQGKYEAGYLANADEH